MSNKHNSYYANFFYVRASILITNIMDKLSLSGTQFYFSLLACDPKQPIYQVCAIKGEQRDDFYTNHPQFYPGYDSVYIALASSANIRNTLFNIHQHYDCDSSLMHHHFMTLYNESTKKSTETEK